MFDLKQTIKNSPLKEGRFSEWGRLSVKSRLGRREIVSREWWKVFGLLDQPKAADHLIAQQWMGGVAGQCFPSGLPGMEKSCEKDESIEEFLHYKWQGQDEVELVLGETNLQHDREVITDLDLQVHAFSMSFFLFSV